MRIVVLAENKDAVKGVFKNTSHAKAFCWNNDINKDDIEFLYFDVDVSEDDDDEHLTETDSSVPPMKFVYRVTLNGKGEILHHKCMKNTRLDSHTLTNLPPPEPRTPAGSNSPYYRFYVAESLEQAIELALEDLANE